MEFCDNYRTLEERLRKCAYAKEDCMSFYSRFRKDSLATARPRSVSYFSEEQSSKQLCFSDLLESSFVEMSEEELMSRCFGPIWSLHWFRIDLDILELFDRSKLELSTTMTHNEDSKADHSCDKRIEIRFIWNSDSEATIFDRDGRILQGLGPERKEFLIPTESSDQINFYSRIFVQMVCSGLFGTGQGLIDPPDEKRTYQVRSCHLSAVDLWKRAEVYDLMTLSDIANTFDPRKLDGQTSCLSRLGWQAAFKGNQRINDAVLKQPLCSSNVKLDDAVETQVNSSKFQISCIANCHIDTAWLWRYEETARKCARSWSATVGLMERYPWFRFACSQMQQLEWVRRDHPNLFQTIQRLSNESRFIPVGGTWVEMDGNLPSGESFFRQFLYGQTFLKEAFGRRTRVFWLPDSFGYSVQLPQIIKLCGCDYFLTQKISWNLVNKFPRNTFWWTGLDGTSVLTHFPSGDSYSMEGHMEELARTCSKFSDHGRSNSAVYLFGLGDGGQGPTEAMLERLGRFSNWANDRAYDFPFQLRFDQTPESFFDNVEKNDGKKLKYWSGELYLELHQGTYTTLASIKQQNFHLEMKLQHVDKLLSTAVFFTSSDGNQLADECVPIMEQAWKLLLLNQFHDVLPGTCIEPAFNDAMTYYRECDNLLNDVCSRIERCSGLRSDLFNSLSWERRFTRQDGGLVVLPPASYGCNRNEQTDTSGTFLWKVAVKERYVVCTSEKFYIEMDFSGRISSFLFDNFQYASSQTETFLNELALYDNKPLFWDAWDIMDYHLGTRCAEGSLWDVSQLEAPILHTETSGFELQFKCPPVFERKLSVTKVVRLTHGRPYVECRLLIDGWHSCAELERRLLRVEFSHSFPGRSLMRSCFGSQYGFMERTSHLNTSWDAAQFEVSGHRFAAVAEGNRGLAVFAVAKYGWHVKNGRLCLSLLKSSKAPHGRADAGSHSISYAIYPFHCMPEEAALLQLSTEFCFPMAEAAFVETPQLTASTLWGISSTDGTTDDNSIVVDTVKISQDRSGLLFRLFESVGFHRRCRLWLTRGVSGRLDPERCRARLVNGLEDHLEDLQLIKAESFLAVQLEFGPFQIRSVLFSI